jgi:hypothetical protein
MAKRASVASHLVTLQHAVPPLWVHLFVTRRFKEEAMLLVLAVVLFAIAIAGGAIIHPVIFVLALVALFMFFSGRRGRTVA